MKILNMKGMIQEMSEKLMVPQQDGLISGYSHWFVIVYHCVGNGVHYIYNYFCTVYIMCHFGFDFVDVIKIKIILNYY